MPALEKNLPNHLTGNSTISNVFNAINHSYNNAYALIEQGNYEDAIFILNETISNINNNIGYQAPNNNSIFLCLANGLVLLSNAYLYKKEYNKYLNATSSFLQILPKINMSNFEIHRTYANQIIKSSEILRLKKCWDNLINWNRHALNMMQKIPATDQTVKDKEMIINHLLNITEGWKRKDLPDIISSYFEKIIGIATSIHSKKLCHYQWQFACHLLHSGARQKAIKYFKITAKTIKSQTPKEQKQNDNLLDSCINYISILNALSTNNTSFFNNHQQASEQTIRTSISPTCNIK